MKKLLLLVILTIISAACAKATPEVTDNGNPGQIKITVFYDVNSNDIQDAGEPGQQARVLIGQDISCPPTDPARYLSIETDEKGEALVADLTAGKYCVAYAGDKPMSSKMTLDVYLSSDQEVQVSFRTLGE